MKKVGTNIVFSPSDLVRFLENPFVSWMDRHHLEFPDATKPDASSEEDKIIQQKRVDHEKSYLGHLAKNGAKILEVPQDDTAWDRTKRAIDEGHDIIYQAALQRAAFIGYADFLRRVDYHSRLKQRSVASNRCATSVPARNTRS